MKAVKNKRDIQLRVNVTASIAAKLENAEDETGYGQSDLVRACVEVGLPLLLSRPGMIPLLQPGVLKESPARG
jgi:hypothetical protein